MEQVAFQRLVNMRHRKVMIKDTLHRGWHFLCGWILNNVSRLLQAGTSWKEENDAAFSKKQHARLLQIFHVPWRLSHFAKKTGLFPHILDEAACFEPRWSSIQILKNKLYWLMLICQGLEVNSVFMLCPSRRLIFQTAIHTGRPGQRMRKSSEVNMRISCFWATAFHPGHRIDASNQKVISLVTFVGAI